MMLRRLWTTALLLILAAASAQAGGDYRGRWWHVPAVAEQLQLTETDIRQLDEAFETSRGRMIELKGRVEIEQGKLRALMERSDLNEVAILEQHRIQEAARKQLADARLEFLLEVRKIIGPNRFNQLLEQREESKKKRYQGKEQ
jgi:Spy/CpxP family protein refolding chaperone